MTKIEKIIEDYKIALVAREEKFRQLKGDKDGLVRKKEVDEIENDYAEDYRREAYHDLRKQAKSDEQFQQEIMSSRNKIFNK